MTLIERSAVQAGNKNMIQLWQRAHRSRALRRTGGRTVEREEPQHNVQNENERARDGLGSASQQRLAIAVPEGEDARDESKSDMNPEERCETAAHDKRRRCDDHDENGTEKNPTCTTSGKRHA